MLGTAVTPESVISLTAVVSKAFSPIETTDAGTETSEREVHLAKTLLPMDVRLLGNKMEVRPESL